ncbi:MAG: DUF2461 domain-containing protein [Bacteroidetes bacterium]|jgi:uncharacterized protein (TIGR02453 family)|nr:DUF2461 domain-containing protein [Bacteroidota bacterium]
MSLKIIPFLAELAQNNHKDWFDEHRNQYDTARTELVELVSEMLNALSPIEPWVSILSPSKCIFRINRDVRFSNNKEPYKTGIGVFIAPGGRSAGNAGYYLHIEPGKSFIGGGIYAPSPEVLKAIRQEIYYNAADFLSIINHPGFKEKYGEMLDERLKRPPKGFPADFDYVELLKYKHYVVSHPLVLDHYSRESMIENLMPYFAEINHFVRFLNESISNAAHGNP